MFIGTALFGWLLSVALGAYGGGRFFPRVGGEALFFVGAVLLPPVLVAVRLSPLVISDVTGEIIPFSRAVLISAGAMLPLGLISGGLFTALAREGRHPEISIMQVYLYEGIGAFLGGVALTLLTGGVASTLEMAVILGGVVLAGVLVTAVHHPWRFVAGAGVALLGISLVLQHSVARVERYIEERKYPGYHVAQSFDTHYAHEVILTRDSTVVLLTDNVVEGTYPDVAKAENMLLPPLLYRPKAERALVVGRAEFGVMQLAEKFPRLAIDALDPRYELSEALAEYFPSRPITFYNTDPVTFFSRTPTARRYDIIILPSTELGSYKDSRLLTVSLLSKMKRFLNEGGIICYPSPYDTERFITDEQKKVLAVIAETFRAALAHVTAWPGEMTLFFASDDIPLTLPTDSLSARSARLECSPQYITDYYLYDRLSDFRRQRLDEALGSEAVRSQITKPVLPHFQALYQAKATSFDRRLLSFLLERPLWLGAILLLVAAFFVLSLRRRNRYAAFSLFLYFTAGLVSLAMELAAFYLYQATAGSLYSELAALIGAFMFGLAFGTYYSMRLNKPHLEYPALVMLLVTLIVFLVTFSHTSPETLLGYYAGFLFVLAAGTGSLFVAATRRYYTARTYSNRGLGYACEVGGSALAALLTTTVLLPIIGLSWLVVGLLAFLILALAGAIVTR